MKKLLPIFTLLASAMAHATTFPAATCNEPDVLTAINSAVAAGSGNTVAVPAGNCTWTTALNVTLGSTISLSIIGAGTSATGGGDVTNITDNVNHGTTDYTIQITTGGPSTSFRWSGITLKNSSTTSNNGVFNLQGTSQSVRLDHSHFANLQQLELNLNSQIYGVIDHNIFDQADLGIRSLGNGWSSGTPGTGDSNGDGSWADATTLGSNRYMYIENNIFNSTIGGGNPVPGNDCLTGGRFVIRFNTFTRGSALQTHPTGHDRGNDRGCRSWEIYGNSFTWSPGDTTNAEFNMFFASAGTGVIWGNAVNQYENFVTLHSMRRNNNTYPQNGPPPAGWGYCGTSYLPLAYANGGTASTTSVWDQNSSSSTGSRCIDQVGSGPGQLISGNFPSKINTVTSTATWPNEALEPVYEWSDSWTGAPGFPGNFWVVQDTPSYTNNVDYYLWCNASSPTGCTTFNGTVGVGSGARSARPATCTTGVAYWSTDQGSWNSGCGSGTQGVLDKCTSPNTWTNGAYVPYSCPHPLTNTTSVVTPTASPAAGSFSTPQFVALSTPTPLAKIFYTVDGSTPTTSSPQYTHPLFTAQNQTIQWIASASGLSNSPVGSAAYGITLANTLNSMSTTSPSFNPVPPPALIRGCCSNDWNNTETARGTFNFAPQDAWTAQAAFFGKPYMYTFSRVPGWSNGGASDATPPNDINTTAACQNVLTGTTTTDCQVKEFVTKFWQHDCGVSSQPVSPLHGVCKTNYWESWNEFNGNGFWVGSYADIATIFNDASKIGHTYNGDLIVVAGSVSAGGDGFNPAGGSPIWYTALATVLADWGAIPGASLPDAISYHVYPSRTTILPVPFPTTLASHSDATCPGTSNSSCRTAVKDQPAVSRGTSLLSAPGTIAWSKFLPGFSTEGAWGEVKDLNSGQGGNATAFSITSNVATITATNGLRSGEKVTMAGWNAGLASGGFNNQTVTVLSSGLSGSQFQFNFTHANVGTTSDPGSFLDADTIILRNAYASQYVAVLAAAGVPQVLWYIYRDDACWAPMVGPGSFSGCTGNPRLPTGNLPWLTAYAQTVSWLNSATSIGALASTSITGGTKWTVPLTIGGSPAELTWCDAWLANCTTTSTFTTQQNLQGATSGFSGTLTMQPVLLTNGVRPNPPTFSIFVQ